MKSTRRAWDARRAGISRARQRQRSWVSRRMPCAASTGSSGCAGNACVLACCAGGGLRANAPAFVPARRLRSHAASAEPVAPTHADEAEPAAATPRVEPVPAPAGYRVLACPHADTLRHRTATVGRSTSQSLVGSPVLVRWPQYGWCLGHISAVARSGELDRGQHSTSRYTIVNVARTPPRYGADKRRGTAHRREDAARRVLRDGVRGAHRERRAAREHKRMAQVGRGNGGGEGLPASL